MKPSPPKPVNAREVSTFFVRISLFCFLTGLLVWFGWKSRWARADAQVVVEAPDAPRPAQAPPAANPTPQIRQEPSSTGQDTRSATGGDTVQPSETLDRANDGQSERRNKRSSEEAPRKPHRRHRTHKPPADEAPSLD